MNDAPLIFPDFDPVAFHILSLPVRWYALAYMAAFLVGLPLVRRLCRLSPCAASGEEVDEFLPWGILGVVLGGRLGYACFYDPSFFAAHPLMIFKVWKGGMSFHGGTCGMLAAMALFARKHRFSFLEFADRVAVVVPLGLGLGRCANFINGELWGRPVAHHVPWAMIFPSVDMLPRHPSQLYEALAEGVALFGVMILCAMRQRIRRHVGLLSGIFLCGYAAARGFCEMFREPDANIGFLFGSSTMGQILSAPMFVAGLGLAAFSFTRGREPPAE